MQDNEYIVCQNVVCSAKGGCGKTTFAIRLALYLDGKQRKGDGKGRRGRPERTCLMDLDLQGSAMKDLLFGENAGGKNGDMFKEGAEIAPFPLNEMMYSLSGIPGRDRKDYISRFEKDGKGFDVVLASIDEDKRAAYFNGDGNYLLPYYALRERMRQIISADEIHSQPNGPYTQLIFDMPANTEMYADVIYDCILDAKYKPESETTDMKLGFRNNLFLVLSQDMSHRGISMQFLKDHFRKRNSVKWDHIFIVINNLFESGQAIDGGYKYFEGKICNEMKPLFENYYDKFTVLDISYDEQYRSICTSQVDGLINIPAEKSKELFVAGDRFCGEAMMADYREIGNPKAKGKNLYEMMVPYARR